MPPVRLLKKTNRYKLGDLCGPNASPVVPIEFCRRRSHSSCLSVSPTKGERGGRSSTSRNAAYGKGKRRSVKPPYFVKSIIHKLHREGYFVTQRGFIITESCEYGHSERSSALRKLRCNREPFVLTPALQHELVRRYTHARTTRLVYGPFKQRCRHSSQRDREDRPSAGPRRVLLGSKRLSCSTALFAQTTQNVLALA